MTTVLAAFTLLAAEALAGTRKPLRLLLAALFGAAVGALLQTAAAPGPAQAAALVLAAIGRLAPGALRPRSDGLPVLPERGPGGALGGQGDRQPAWPPYVACLGAPVGAVVAALAEVPPVPAALLLLHGHIAALGVAGSSLVGRPAAAWPFVSTFLAAGSAALAGGRSEAWRGPAWGAVVVLALAAAAAASADALEDWVRRRARRGRVRSSANVRSPEARDLLRSMHEALAKKEGADWDGIVVRAERWAAEAPALAHDVALAAALGGARGPAVALLERLAASPGAPPLVLATFSLVARPLDPRAALRAATRLAERLPRDPLGPLLAARAALEDGRIDEAAQHVREAARRDGATAPVLALAAEVEIARGRLSSAAWHLRRAHRLDPTLPEAALARARLAVAAEGREQARRLVEAALETCRAHPLSFLEEDARRLARAWTERDDGARG